MSVTVDTTSQRFTSADQPEPDVWCLHTTEVMAWPPYSGGGEAPHSTIEAIPGVGIRVREHIPVTQYAKALMNLPGGSETNRRGVIQDELKGTCNPAHRGDPDWYYWPDADDVVLAALADYRRPTLAKYGIPHAGPAFLAYPKSYGSAGGQRMTAAEWNAFNGICGHQHVPENDHGDPGAFPLARLVAALNRTAAPVAPEPTMEDIMGDLILTNPLTHKEASAGTGFNSMWAYSVLTFQAVKAMAAKVGVDVDEAELAKQLSLTLGPQLREAITATLAAQPDASTDQIADAVVARLGAALTPKAG